MVFNTSNFKIFLFLNSIINSPKSTTVDTSLNLAITTDGWHDQTFRQLNWESRQKSFRKSNVTLAVKDPHFTYDQTEAIPSWGTLVSFPYTIIVYSLGKCYGSTGLQS